MQVSLVVAMDADRVIGSESGKIPWDVPRDREHFRARTAGRWVLAGRKTYLEMEGWFGDRIPVVLTRDRNFQPFESGHRVAHSVAEALDLASGNGVLELVVVGGSGVFAAILPWADRILLTRIDLRTDLADPVRFPEFESSGRWKLRHAENWPGKAGIPSARYEIYESLAAR